LRARSEVWRSWIHTGGPSSLKQILPIGSSRLLRHARPNPPDRHRRQPKQSEVIVVVTRLISDSGSDRLERLLELNRRTILECDQAFSIRHRGRTHLNEQPRRRQLLWCRRRGVTPQFQESGEATGAPYCPALSRSRRPWFGESLVRIFSGQGRKPGSFQ